MHAGECATIAPGGGHARPAGGGTRASGDLYATVMPCRGQRALATSAPTVRGRAALVEQVGEEVARHNRVRACLQRRGAGDHPERTLMEPISGPDCREEVGSDGVRGCETRCNGERGEADERGGNGDAHVRDWIESVEETKREGGSRDAGVGAVVSVGCEWNQSGRSQTVEEVESERGLWGLRDSALSRPRLVIHIGHA